jgi:hypothetical protein
MTRLRPTPSSVIAVFAVVVAMSGTAVASSHISGSSIKKHSIAGNRLKNNSLGGKQINENKLGVVPRAGSVDGVIMKRVFSVVPSGGAATTIATFGRLKVNFGCDNGGTASDLQLDVVSTFTTGDANSVIDESGSTAIITFADSNYMSGDSLDLTNANTDHRVTGDLSVAWSDGHYSNFHFTDDFPDIFNSVHSCVVAGIITFA